ARLVDRRGRGETLAAGAAGEAAAATGSRGGECAQAGAARGDRRRAGRERRDSPAAAGTLRGERDAVVASDDDRVGAVLDRDLARVTGAAAVQRHARRAAARLDEAAATADRLREDAQRIRAVDHDGPVVGDVDESAVARRAGRSAD